jgi:hypothetical protein
VRSCLVSRLQGRVDEPLRFVEDRFFASEDEEVVDDDTGLRAQSGGNTRAPEPVVAAERED